MCGYKKKRIKSGRFWNFIIRFVICCSRAFWLVCAMVVLRQSFNRKVFWRTPDANLRDPERFWSFLLSVRNIDQHWQNKPDGSRNAQKNQEVLQENRTVPERNGRRGPNETRDHRRVRNEDRCGCFNEIHGSQQKYQTKGAPTMTENKWFLPKKVQKEQPK